LRQGNQQIEGPQKKYQEFMNEKMMEYLKEMKERKSQEIGTPTTRYWFHISSDAWTCSIHQKNLDSRTVPKQIKLEDYENPYVQVVWEEHPENFTQERIKSVKQYFSKKYNSLNVNVITKTIQPESVNQTVDVSFNIMDKNYQRELIESLLESKNQGEHFEKVVAY
jgi:hypothetical protein